MMIVDIIRWRASSNPVFGTMFQVLAEESLETTTANATTTAHLHLSHKTWPQDIAAPAAPAASSVAFALNASDADDDGRGAGAFVGKASVVGAGGLKDGRVGGVTILVDCCGGRCSPILGTGLGYWVQYSGKASLNFGWVKFQAWLLDANCLFCASLDVTDPVVISSESINDSRPVRIVATLQAGFQEPG